jgi:predicted metal-dependent hydrolase
LDAKPRGSRTPAQTLTVRVGDRDVACSIVRKRMKNIVLHVDRHGRVSVSAPRWAPKREIVDFVESQTAFLGRELDLAGQQALRDAMSQFVPGAVVKILGVDYRLDLQESPSDRVILYEEDGVVGIYSRFPKDSSYVERQYLKWLRILAGEVFAASAERTMALLAPYGIERPELSVRLMSACWGICDWRHGRVKLNLRLIKALPLCIDYIMLHEFAHLRHPDHSESYYHFLTRLMPDWKFRKNLLNREVGIGRW